MRQSNTKGIIGVPAGVIIVGVIILSTVGYVLYNTNHNESLVSVEDRQLPPTREIPTREFPESQNQDGSTDNNKENNETPEKAPPTDQKGNVRVVSTDSCASAITGATATCYYVGVTCGGIDERFITIKRFSQDNSIGGVLFMGPGNGSKTYTANNSSRLETTKTAQVLYDAGYEIYDLYWSTAGGANGWLEGVGEVAGGYKGAFCGYAEVAKWINTKIMDAPQTMCALGNSGGSFQISYGLTYYGLDTLLDMVIFTGGPPVPRFDEACFAGGGPNRTADATVGDELNGWKGNGDYCTKGSAPQSIKDIADRDSLISDLTPGKYAYSTTKVYSLGAEGDGFFMNSREYFDTISAEEKDWFVYSGRDHWFDGNAIGGAKARELFLNKCN